MVKLSNRLAAIASCIPENASVIDVGTDHGLIPVWLAQREQHGRIMATDIHPDPLQRARELAAETDTADRIELRVCDGLGDFPSSDCNCVVIAGMGGETMIHILSAAPWTKEGVLLILQPQTKQAELRRWLTENGYKIDREELVSDAGRIYPYFTAFGGEGDMFSPAEYLVGKKEKIVHNALFWPYCELLLKRLRKAAPHDEAAAELFEELSEWKDEEV